MFPLFKDCNEDFKWFIGNEDAFCDDFVNTASCNFDGGDCCGPNRKINHCTQCICYADSDCSASLLGIPVKIWFRHVMQNTPPIFWYFRPIIHIIVVKDYGRNFKDWLNRPWPHWNPIQCQYRAGTGFSLCTFSHREKPVFITGEPCSHCRDPVFITGISLGEKSTQRKPCFHYREWVCSALKPFLPIWQGWTSPQKVYHQP